MCHSWLDWCRTYWTCGSQYDYEAYFTTPPPPCPAPPPNYTPPAEPGVCQFNLNAGYCQYHHSSEFANLFVLFKCNKLVKFNTVLAD